MAIEASCSCGKRFKAHDKYAGKRVLCPGCKQPLQIPAEEVLEVDLEPLEDEDDGTAYAVSGADNTIDGAGFGGMPRMVGELGCHHLSPGNEIISCLAVARDGAIALAGIRGTVYVLNVRGGKQFFRLEAHRHAVRCLALAPNGRLGLSGDTAGTLLLWDLIARTPLRQLPGHLNAIHSIEFSPDGSTALTASGDGTVRLWDIALGQELRRIKEFEVPTRAAYSPDGRRALIGMERGSVRLWDLERGERLQELKQPPPGPIEALAFTPDGRRVLAAGFGGKAAWGAWDWDATKGPGRYRKVAAGTYAGLFAIAFTPDGTRLLGGGAPVSVDEGAILREYTPAVVLSVESGQLLHEFPGHLKKPKSRWHDPELATITCAVVTADGFRGLTGGNDGRVQVWGLG